MAKGFGQIMVSSVRTNKVMDRSSRVVGEYARQIVRVPRLWTVEFALVYSNHIRVVGILRNHRTRPVIVVLVILRKVASKHGAVLSKSLQDRIIIQVLPSHVLMCMPFFILASARTFVEATSEQMRMIRSRSNITSDKEFQRVVLIIGFLGSDKRL